MIGTIVLICVAFVLGYIFSRSRFVYQQNGCNNDQECGDGFACVNNQCQQQTQPPTITLANQSIDLRTVDSGVTKTDIIQ